MCERLVLRLTYHGFAVFWQVKDTEVTLKRGSAGLQPQRFSPDRFGVADRYAIVLNDAAAATL